MSFEIALVAFSEAETPNATRETLEVVLPYLNPSNATQFLTALLLHPFSLLSFTTHEHVAFVRSQYLFDFDLMFGQAVCEILPEVMVSVVRDRLDLSFDLLLSLLPSSTNEFLEASVFGCLIGCIRDLHSFLESEKADRENERGGEGYYLYGMRCCSAFMCLWMTLSVLPHLSPYVNSIVIPSCVIDNDDILSLKTSRTISDLPAAYATRINQLQKLDLKSSIESLTTTTTTTSTTTTSLLMSPTDFSTRFTATSPLRLGLSSANASDNHCRSKEQGGKTLNVAINLLLHQNQTESESEEEEEGEREETPSEPIRVTVFRIEEKGQLRINSISRSSSSFQGSFNLLVNSVDSDDDEFFLFRNSNSLDHCFRLVKQALIFVGIVSEKSRSNEDVRRDVEDFTQGGGLVIMTQSQVMQGSGLGTSSILAAVILKVLYRICGKSEEIEDYPTLFDHSLLLEQSLGLNSGWQDARGCWGSGEGGEAVKDFYAPPTDLLPAPTVRFIAVSDELFCDRVVVFDTGIGRFATKGLNTVLGAYLSRDVMRYSAIRKSLEMHDDMVRALENSDYDSLGVMCSEYWRLRVTIDPRATNPILQFLFEDESITSLSCGGLLTGAGGGGFAILVARDGMGDALRERLGRLRESVDGYERSAVVEYELNPNGIKIVEE